MAATRAHVDGSEDGPLAAGRFSTWLAATERALAGDADAEVPCGTCTACCTSSQFVHIEPDEVETLARVPAALRFPAPRLPAGHVLLGFDQRGHCPMLVDGTCTIYDHRPRTCRTYDCRVFPAAGVEPDEARQPAIARRARRWRFELPTELDRQEIAAVQAAAASVTAGDESGTSVSATERAVVAVRRYRDHLPTGPGAHDA
ncbi:MAG TPA: YkgJ family cysteine cluster protein [Acidimicrobiia bacterium]|jgi:Fe-S-cluster containining protein